MKGISLSRLLIITGILGVVAGLIFSLSTLKKPNESQASFAPASPVVEASPVPTPQEPEKQVAEPAFFVIPKLGVNTTIEPVGTDQEGKMDVPKDDWNVGWYSLGIKPGEKGSAVMAGHLDTATGAPAVFYNLSRLTLGDEVSVVSQEGKNLVFTVIKIQNYPYDQVPMQEVFELNDKPRLNLITCTGVWNTGDRNYSNRLVVYTEIKE